MSGCMITAQHQITAGPLLWPRLPEAGNAHEGTVESQQGTGLHHMLLSEAGVPGAAPDFHATVIRHVGAT